MLIEELLVRNKGTWLNYNALVRVSTSLVFYSDSLRISVTKIIFVSFVRRAFVLVS